MSGARRWVTGFTLLELVVVIIIISILLAIAAERLLKIRAQAERAAVARAVGNMRSALGMRLAKDIADDNWPAIGKLAGSNPMTLMTRIPGNYLGVIQDPEPAKIAGMQWYFDAGAGALVYRIRYAESFRSPLPGPARLRFRIEAQYRDRNGNGRFDPRVDGFEGLDLVPLEHVAWPNGSARVN
ncbi:MAG TPA: prepilin-type N-terminal cleavage/methylation domain-containing protein [Gammaproteobacteria bacterium]|nr:prepilin-type N-terminal cleavage/methylation domain-containing protein [Gammaproteobacteria bacterium]